MISYLRKRAEQGLSGLPDNELERMSFVLGKVVHLTA